MKNSAVLVLTVLVIFIIGILLFAFVVRETESAVVTTFGKHTRTVSEPGLYFRILPPIQRVYKFDSRMQTFEAELVETTTKGNKPIIVSSYVVWKIADPLKFFTSCGTMKGAQDTLLSQLKNTQGEVIGQYTFSEFVNSDESKIKIQEIESRMLAGLKKAVFDDYGIEVKMLGLKQLKVDKDVTKEVFARMQAERDSKTQATISEGESEAIRIRTDVDSKKDKLMAAAESRAKMIRGQGDAEAAKYYKMLEADPEFAIFLRNIEALNNILKERSTVVLSADSEPFELLKKMPKIEPKK
jgi:modulator of FtsH protease HflC